MNETSYTINHAGYTVHREAARFRSLDGSDALKNLSVTDGKYKSIGLRVDSGNVWLDGTPVVQKGRALCFAAAYGDYTFIRRAGEDVIEVEGPGISAPMKWDSSFRTSTPGYKRVIMQGGGYRRWRRMHCTSGSSFWTRHPDVQSSGRHIFQSQQLTAHRSSRIAISGHEQ